MAMEKSLLAPCIFTSISQLCPHLHQNHKGQLVILENLKIDQVKFAVGTTYRQRNSGSHFCIDMCQHLEKRRLTGMVHVKDITSGEEEWDSYLLCDQFQHHCANTSYLEIYSPLEY